MPQAEMASIWRAFAGTLDALVAPSFGAPGYYARKKTWQRDSIPVDLSGKTYVVTGANSGIGFATTRILVERGATVRMGCRSEERGNAALQKLSNNGWGKLELDIVDMSSLKSVRQWCQKLSDVSIDALVHNAGALVHERTKTEDDLELTFACHVAGPFLATQLLRKNLQGGRVIFVSSGGMYTQQLYVPRLVEGGPDPFDGVVAYAQCKRAQVVLSHELASRWDDVSFASMHPGWVDTSGVRTSLPAFHKFTRSFLRSEDQGADTIVWLAASDEPELNGEFYFDRMVRREHIPGKNTQTPREDVELLWRLLETLTTDYSSVS